ncbi:hypothetical protein SNEBB_009104, partial [Seison nebaliae]
MATTQNLDWTQHITTPNEDLNLTSKQTTSKNDDDKNQNNNNKNEVNEKNNKNNVKEVVNPWRLRMELAAKTKVKLTLKDDKRNPRQSITKENPSFPNDFPTYQFNRHNKQNNHNKLSRRGQDYKGGRTSGTTSSTSATSITSNDKKNETKEEEVNYRPISPPKQNPWAKRKVTVSAAPPTEEKEEIKTDVKNNINKIDNMKSCLKTKVLQTDVWPSLDSDLKTPRNSTVQPSIPNHTPQSNNHYNNRPFNRPSYRHHYHNNNYHNRNHRGQMSNVASDYEGDQSSDASSAKENNSSKNYSDGRYKTHQNMRKTNFIKRPRNANGRYGSNYNSYNNNNNFNSATSNQP